MRRTLEAAALIAALAGCAGAQGRPQAASTASPATSTQTSTQPPTPTSASTSTSAPTSTRAPTAAAAPPTATTPTSTPSAPPSLPPARPTTIRLGAGELAAGDDAFERGDLAAAKKHYASAPEGVAATVGLARVRIASVGVPLDYAAARGNREVAAAARDLAVAARRAPSFGPAFVELGRARLLLGDAPGALDALRKGVQLMPDEPEAAGRTREAIAEYETRVRMDDGDARAHSDLGTALLATQDLERAVSELERAVQLDPQRAAFHSNLGYALQQEGRADRALAEYHEALRLDPKLASAWINLATVLARNPRTRADARAALLQARALSPDDPRVKANLEELDALDRSAPAAAHQQPR
jgi:tetratricopeptide (TPR) repeat protein